MADTIQHHSGIRILAALPNRLATAPAVYVCESCGALEPADESTFAIACGSCIDGRGHFMNMTRFERVKD